VAPDTIIGRRAELDVVASFFDRETSGATALLIDGSPGIGKTTVWHEAVRMCGAPQDGRSEPV